MRLFNQLSRRVTVPLLRYAKKTSTIGAAAGDRGLPLFDVFLLDGDAAFAVDLDTGVVYDDLIDQCLHDHGIVGIQASFSLASGKSPLFYALHPQTKGSRLTCGV